MFGTLSLESVARRVNVPAVKLDADPEVHGLVKGAWAKQEAAEGPLGHIVDLGTEELVAAFHEHGRAAALAHEPRLVYRKLNRVGTDKATTKAYFAVTKWVERAKAEKTPAEAPADSAVAEEVPEAPAPAKAAPARRTTKGTE